MVLRSREPSCLIAGRFWELYDNTVHRHTLMSSCILRNSRPLLPTWATAPTTLLPSGVFAAARPLRRDLFAEHGVRPVNYLCLFENNIFVSSLYLCLLLEEHGMRPVIYVPVRALSVSIYLCSGRVASFVWRGIPENLDSNKSETEGEGLRAGPNA